MAFALAVTGILCHPDPLTNQEANLTGGLVRYLPLLSMLQDSCLPFPGPAKSSFEKMVNMANNQLSTCLSIYSLLHSL